MMLGAAWFGVLIYIAAGRIGRSRLGDCYTEIGAGEVKGQAYGRWQVWRYDEAALLLTIGF